MTIDKCDPCTCIPGYLGTSEWYQKVLEAQCLILAAIEAGGGVGISPDAGNEITLHANGIYAPAQKLTAVSDTSTIDLTIGGTIPQTLSAAAKISPDAGNELVAHANGLYAPGAPYISSTFSHPNAQPGVLYTFTHGLPSKPTSVQVFTVGYDVTGAPDVNSVLVWPDLYIVAGNNSGFLWSTTNTVLSVYITTHINAPNPTDIYVVAKV